MAPIRSTDLLNRLTSQAAEGAKKADANNSGTITKAEEAGLPAVLKEEVAAHRAREGTVKTAAFVSKFGADVRAEVARVDTNHDGMVTDAEQARLAHG